MAPFFAPGRLIASVAILLWVSACTIDVDEPTEPDADNRTPVLTNEAAQSDPSATDQDAPMVQGAPAVQDATLVSQPNANTQVAEDGATADINTDVVPDTNQSVNPGSNTDSMPETNAETNPGTNLGPQPLVGQSGIARSDNALAELLATDYVIENEQVIPTTVWICTDVFEQSRSYYFYDAGVINPVRNVAIERTLNGDEGFVDITFFWSVSGNDSILLSSLVAGNNGALVSTGQQYDMQTIRFTEVGAKPVFTAQTLLRGGLTCAIFDLR